MAHNAYIRPGNVWSGSPAFLTAEITPLALQVYQSLNADLGGTWTPSSVITIGGSGLTVTGESRLDDWKGATCTDGTVTFGLNAVCGFTSNASLGFGGTSALVMGSGSTLLMQSGATGTIAAPCTFSGALTFSAGAHAYAGNTVSGTIVRTGLTTQSGVSGRTQVRQSTVSNVNTTVGNEIDTLIYLQTNGVNHGLTLRATTGVAATAGERLRVIWRRTPSTAGTLLVSCETAGTLIDFGVGGTSAAIEDNACGADFEFDGTQWRVATKWGDTASVAGLVSP